MRHFRLTTRPQLLLPLALANAFALASPSALIGVPERTLQAGEPTGSLAPYAKSRTWTDSSGKHKIQGEMSFADKKAVQILQSNGKTVRIEFAGLSSADQSFILKFLKAERGANKNPIEEAAMASRSVGSGSGLSYEMESDAEKEATDEDAPSDSLDQIPVRKTSVQNVKRFSGNFEKPFWSVKPIKGFPDPQFEEFAITTPLEKPFHATARIQAGGTFGVNVVNVYQRAMFGDPAYSRTLVVFSKDGSATPITGATSAWKLAAISPDGKRVAMVRVEGFDEGSDVGVFNVTREGLEPSFQFTAGGGTHDHIIYVGFAAGNRLVTISGRNNVGVWDLSNDKVVKAIYVGTSGGARHAELSPARELMALPANKGVAIIDLVGAKLAGLIERTATPSQIRFSPDGKHLAVFEPFELAIYSMENGSLIRTVPTSEHRTDAFIGWLGNYVMVGDVVYDVERALPLWTYESRDAIRTTLGSNLYSVFPTDKNTSITLNRLPHSHAIDAARDADPVAIYAVKPGDEVSLEFNLRTALADKQTEIRKIVEEKLTKLGWKVTPNASVRVLVEMESGTQQSADYYTSNSRSPIFHPRFGARPTGPKETVTFIPWTYTFAIYTGDKKESEFVNTVGTPQSFATGEGESTQAAVTRLTQPSSQFFEGLILPPHLLKAEYQGGFGKSKITINGLER